MLILSCITCIFIVYFSCSGRTLKISRFDRQFLGNRTEFDWSLTEQVTARAEWVLLTQFSISNIHLRAEWIVFLNLYLTWRSFKSLVLYFQAFLFLKIILNLKFLISYTGWSLSRKLTSHVVAELCMQACKINILFRRLVKF